jgi:hypothetical protein
MISVVFVVLKDVRFLNSLMVILVSFPVYVKVAHFYFFFCSILFGLYFLFCSYVG